MCPSGGIGRNNSQTQARPRRVQELLNLAAGYLQENGVDTPRLDAEVLLAKVLGMRRIDLYVNYDRPLEPPEVEAYRHYIARRARGVPVAYLTGEKEFMSLPLSVAPGVLIPRPETEVLVEKILEHLKKRADQLEKPVRMIDVGTGSGAIAISVARMFPDVVVNAVDISDQALQVAGNNVARHGLSERIRVFKSDLFSAVEAGKTYHVITSNPPYIAQKDLPKLDREVRAQPRIALDGGPTGLSFYRRIVSAASTYLEPGGFGALEIGANQAREVREIIVRHGFTDVEVYPDYAGRDRVIVFGL